MKFKALGATVFVASIISTTLVGIGPAQAKDIIPAPGESIPDQYIVVLKDSVSDTEAASASAVKGTGASRKTVFKSALKGFSVKANKSQITEISRDPNVKAVYQDGIAKASVVQPIPAPPDAAWGLNRIDQRRLPANTAGNYIFTRTAPAVRVYVLDTGIRTTHSQFRTGFRSRAQFVFSATGIGQPGVDCNGHGTHVAGTVGGRTYGVAKSVQLRAVKVLNCAGSGSFTQIIEGVDFVTRNAIKPAVANMSLGGGVFVPLNTAVTNSINSGITYVVAAGNESTNACTKSPASTPAAITVGSTGNFATPSTPISDARSSFSNFGSCLDIFAPGAFIRSSINTSNTAAATFSGTSMASPHVAGVVAQVLQIAPSARPATIRNFLVGRSTRGNVTNPGTGSPNALLYSRL